MKTSNEIFESSELSKHDERIPCWLMEMTENANKLNVKRFNSLPAEMVSPIFPKMAKSRITTQSGRRAQTFDKDKFDFNKDKKEYEKEKQMTREITARIKESNCISASLLEKRSKFNNSSNFNFSFSEDELKSFSRQLEMDLLTELHQKSSIILKEKESSIDVLLSNEMEKLSVESLEMEKSRPSNFLRRQMDDIIYSPKSSMQENDNFIIPDLPFGQHLVIDILSTWGDKQFVGLNGIEIFSSTGEPAIITAISSSVDIAANDTLNNSRNLSVSNLINGVYRTTNDLEMWSAPFTNGNHHYIYITFLKSIYVGLIRIWNYNKSQIHSYQGAKTIVIKLNDVVIFDGNIAKASGDILGDINSYGDTILFTTDDKALESILKYDKNFYKLLNEEHDVDHKKINRPIIGTAEKNNKLYINQCINDSQCNTQSSDKNTSIPCKEIKLILLSN